MIRSRNLTSLHVIQNRQVTNIHMNDSLSGRQFETMLLDNYIPKYTGRTKKKGVLFLDGDI